MLGERRREAFHVARLAITAVFADEDKSHLEENYLPTFMVDEDWQHMLNSCCYLLAL